MSTLGNVLTKYIEKINNPTLFEKSFQKEPGYVSSFIASLEQELKQTVGIKAVTIQQVKKELEQLLLTTVSIEKIERTANTPLRKKYLDEIRAKNKQSGTAEDFNRYLNEVLTTLTSTQVRAVQDEIERLSRDRSPQVREKANKIQKALLATPLSDLPTVIFNSDGTLNAENKVLKAVNTHRHLPLGDTQTFKNIKNALTEDRGPSTDLSNAKPGLKK
jgi:hypothetical protein